MSFRNAFGIYHVLERLLKESPKPLTCTELFDSPDVKKLAEDANKVSDYLGHMYRRGLLDRVAAPKTLTSGAARYAYTWKDPTLGSQIVPRMQQPKLVLSQVPREDREPVPVRRTAAASAPAPAPATKPNIDIVATEEGIVIDHPQYTIRVSIK